MKSITSLGLAFGFFAAMAAPALAQTTTPATSTASSKIACVGSAVSAREQSIGSAEMTYTKALDAAYSARAAALSQAYTQTTSSAVHEAVKEAWSAFGQAVRGARHSWQSSRNSAWRTFRTASRACHASSSVNDGGNAGAEVSGQ